MVKLLNNSSVWGRPMDDVKLVGNNTYQFSEPSRLYKGAVKPVIICGEHQGPSASVSTAVHVSRAGNWAWCGHHERNTYRDGKWLKTASGGLKWAECWDCGCSVKRNCRLSECDDCNFSAGGSKPVSNTSTFTEPDDWPDASKPASEWVLARSVFNDGWGREADEWLVSGVDKKWWHKQYYDFTANTNADNEEQLVIVGSGGSYPVSKPEPTAKQYIGERFGKTGLGEPDKAGRIYHYEWVRWTGGLMGRPSCPVEYKARWKDAKPDINNASKFSEPFKAGVRPCLIRYLLVLRDYEPDKRYSNGRRLSRMIYWSDSRNDWVNDASQATRYVNRGVHYDYKKVEQHIREAEYNIARNLPLSRQLVYLTEVWEVKLDYNGNWHGCHMTALPEGIYQSSTGHEVWHLKPLPSRWR